MKTKHPRTKSHRTSNLPQSLSPSDLRKVAGGMSRTTTNEHMERQTQVTQKIKS